eukprot:1968030-Rhodomonas_salina.1
MHSMRHEILAVLPSTRGEFTEMLGSKQCWTTGIRGQSDALGEMGENLQSVGLNGKAVSASCGEDHDAPFLRAVSEGVSDTMTKRSFAKETEEKSSV